MGARQKYQSQGSDSIIVVLHSIDMTNGIDRTLKRLAGKITYDSRKYESEFEPFFEEHHAASITAATKILQSILEII